ncbi:MAG: hypothetical protein IKI31_06445 [Treponema sp.]|nr:hypothetical protein [Treponema sp.]
MFIRSGGTSIEDSLLQKMIYEIIIKKGASSAITASFSFISKLNESDIKSP